MERLKLNIQRFAEEPTYYTSGNLIDEEALYEYHDKMKTFVNNKIPTKTSDLTNDSDFLENKLFSLEDIMAITSNSDTTYSELAQCIGNKIPFQIIEILGHVFTYDAINTYNTGTEIGFEYIDTNNNVVKITLEGRSSITVTRTTTPYQEKITSTNKLDYSLVDNTPTIPENTSDLTNDSGFITSSYHDSSKQDSLVSGTNIKTINSQSLLGSGNITIGGGGTATDVQINGSSIVSSNVANLAVDGTYNSSTNKIATMSSLPTVPTNVSAFTNDSGYITGINSSDVTTALGYTPYNSSNPSGYITNSTSSLANYTLSSNLSTVATSGSYNDLSDQPTIPSLSGLMYMEEVTLVSNATIAANSSYGSSTQTKTISPKSGYTPVLVVPSNTYDRRVSLWYARIDTDTTIRWRAANNGSTQLTGISVVVQVLYVKTSATLGRNPSATLGRNPS